MRKKPKHLELNAFFEGVIVAVWRAYTAPRVGDFVKWESRLCKVVDVCWVPKIDGVTKVQISLEIED